MDEHDETEREEIYRDAKIVKNWKESDTPKQKKGQQPVSPEVYIRQLASQTLTDIYKELTKTDDRVLVVIDDINTLSKGQLRSNTESTDEKLSCQKASGEAVLQLCLPDQGNPFRNAKNAMFFVAASQHFHEFSKMQHTTAPVRIKPMTSIWDIMGITFFLFKNIKDVPNLKNAKVPFLVSLIKTCMIKCGLLLRLLIGGTKDAIVKFDADNARCNTEENKDGLVCKFLNCIMVRVDSAVQQRYEEVFRTFFQSKEKKDVPIGFFPSTQTDESKRMQTAFLERTQKMFSTSTFSLDDQRNSPYFDTGIIVESMRSADEGKFGFVSNIAKIAYGRQLASMTMPITSPLEIQGKEYSDFQERIENRFRFGGFVSNENIRGYVDNTKAPIEDVPPAFMTVKLTFDYIKKAQKRPNIVPNGSDLPEDSDPPEDSDLPIGSIKLNTIKFNDVDDKKAFRVWMAGSNDISQSVLFVGKGPGGANDMPAFDQVLVTKKVNEQGERNTFFYAFQNTLETLQNGHIKPSRFVQMKGNGIKLLGKIARVGYDDTNYDVILKRDGHFGVVDGNKDAVSHTGVAIFYVNPKGEARKGPSSKDPGFVLYVIGAKAIEVSFKMEYIAPPVTEERPKKTVAKWGK